MALENKQETVNLTADSVVDEEVIVMFSARVPNDGVGSGVSLSIRNKELYDENKSTVRQDQQEFQNLVWDTEDRLSEIGRASCRERV